MLKPTQQLELALMILKNHLKINLADYMLLIGLVLIGTFFYITFGLTATILYVGVLLVIGSVIIGLTKAPDKNIGRKY